MLMSWLRRLICLLFDHKRIGDDTWGGYGWTCSRCGKNDYGIHDM
jgi:hypothetical protein